MHGSDAGSDQHSAEPARRVDARIVASSGIERAGFRVDWLALSIGWAGLCSLEHDDGGGLGIGLLAESDGIVRPRAATEQRDSKPGSGAGEFGIGTETSLIAGLLACAFVPHEQLAVSVGTDGRRVGILGR